MASNAPITSRRGLLGILAAAPLVAAAVPATASPAIITALAVPSDGWKACVAEYMAAKLAMEQADAHYEAVAAACRAAYGKIVVPPGLRSPMAKAMGWFDMSIDELREDMLARRGGRTPGAIATVNRDLKGVPRFKKQQARAMAPKRAARELVDSAVTRFSDAEDRLRDFPVGTLAELAEKAEIARSDNNDWIMDGVHADMRRLAGGAN